MDLPSSLEHFGVRTTMATLHAYFICWGLDLCLCVRAWVLVLVPCCAGAGIIVWLDRVSPRWSDMIKVICSVDANDAQDAGIYIKMYMDIELKIIEEDGRWNNKNNRNYRNDKNNKNKNNRNDRNKNKIIKIAIPIITTITTIIIKEQ